MPSGSINEYWLKDSIQNEAFEDFYDIEQELARLVTRCFQAVKPVSNWDWVRPKPMAMAMPTNIGTSNMIIHSIMFMTGSATAGHWHCCQGSAGSATATGHARGHGHRTVTTLALTVTDTDCHWHRLSLTPTVTDTDCHWHRLSLTPTVTDTDCHWHWLSLTPTVTDTDCHWHCHCHWHWLANTVRVTLRWFWMWGSWELSWTVQ